MAQPQQQSYTVPQRRPFSPSPGTPSPGAQQSFDHQNKRLKTSPPPPTNSSLYSQPQYPMSPTTSGPQSTGASPVFRNVQLPQIPPVYSNSPYANGNTTPTFPLTPANQPNGQINGQSNQYFNPPNQSPLSLPGQTPNNFHSNHNNYMMHGQQNTGTMGPPLKPPERLKEDGIDPMDVLGGTGIDLREEEQYTFQFPNSSFNSQQTGSQAGTISPSHSFTQFPPGDAGSLYGAGPANAAAEATGTKSQMEYEQKVADKAWHDAARNLAVTRERELSNPFLTVGLVHQRAAKIAREHGLDLNTDASKNMGTMRRPNEFSSSDVNVQTMVGPIGTMVATNGTFLPYDSLLVDQLALISVATKYRLRELLEDAARLAKGRQTGSHGVIPENWEDAAAASKTEATSLVVKGAPRSGYESANSPRSTPASHLHSNANLNSTPVSEGVKPHIEAPKLSNIVVSALRKSATHERDQEEARRQRRNARLTGETIPRQSSVIPATPGSVAPESNEKAPTKKEMKKKAEAKTNEAASHAAANNTTLKFLGGGGGGLFGKKKKNYGWMTAGSASGANTPGRIMTQGLPGTPAGVVVNAAPERLTSDGARRLGTWREDKEKGRGVQIRDWVAVLEVDGRERKALQRAYASLDYSEPK